MRRGYHLIGKHLSPIVTTQLGLLVKDLMQEEMLWKENVSDLSLLKLYDCAIKRYMTVNGNH